MDELTKCFMCQGELVSRSDGDLDCLSCKRVLYKLPSGDWATRRTKVKLKKPIKPGERYDECVEVVSDDD